jgi:hypothetical protein
VISITNLIWIVALNFDADAFNKTSFNPQNPRVVRNALLSLPGRSTKFTFTHTATIGSQ